MSKVSHEEIVLRLSKINPQIDVVGRFDGSTSKALVRCKICGYEWFKRANGLLTGDGCPVCAGNKKKTHDQFVAKLSEKNPNIEVLEKYINLSTKILMRCKLCGHEWSVIPHSVLRGRGCPKCAAKARAIHTKKFTPKSFKTYFESKYPDIEVIGDYSRIVDPVLLKCRHCGLEFERAPHKYVWNNGNVLRCPGCSDGISYPNKFARALLSQLPVSHKEIEWSPDWAINGSKHLYYDNYFEHNGGKYILEMDGGFHYKETNMGWRPLSQVQEIDELKNRLATEHGISMIRIDSRKSNMNYLVENIKSSHLKDIFDLSAVDWLQCERIARGNKVKEVCDYYMTVSDSTSVIAKHFELSGGTVTRYLKIGANAGFCNYPHARGIAINTYDHNGTLIFENKSIGETSRLFRELGTVMVEKKIKDTLSGKFPNYKGYTFSRFGPSGQPDMHPICSG